MAESSEKGSRRVGTAEIYARFVGPDTAELVFWRNLGHLLTSVFGRDTGSLLAKLLEQIAKDGQPWHYAKALQLVDELRAAHTETTHKARVRAEQAMQHFFNQLGLSTSERKLVRRAVRVKASLSKAEMYQLRRIFAGLAEIFNNRAVTGLRELHALVSGSHTPKRDRQREHPSQQYSAATDPAPPAPPGQRE